MEQDTSHSPPWLLLSDLCLWAAPSPFPLCSSISRQCSWLVGGKIAKIAVLLTPGMNYTRCNGDGASPLRGQTPTGKGHQAQCEALLCSATERHCRQTYLASQDYLQHFQMYFAEILFTVVKKSRILYFRHVNVC